ncbi:MAG: hypothetical protein GXP55_20130 [Deltaproteobacteria bacterium]|nr:hypothetical protein [Deltaproteobacteria bacterium]
MSLRDVLTDESRKAAVVSDCLSILDAEVKSKKGLSGMAIKTGYKVVKGFKPGFVKNVVTDLLPEFADALEPMADAAKAAGEPAARYFAAHSGELADALLSITDKKAARSTNRVVKGTYDKLRPTAKRHVGDAAPRLGGLVDKYVS